MAVSGVTDTGTTTQKTSGSNAFSQLTGNFDFFLKMLTTQLQNQDPLEPQDPSEFTNQLVQFSSVEQQIQTNDKLEKMLNQTAVNGTTAMLGYIGNTVDVSGNSIGHDGASTATLSYNLPEIANSANMVISDSKGNVVKTFAVPTVKGQSTVTWDGKNSAGAAAPAGVYTFKVVATNIESKPIENIDTATTGVVTGVESGENGGLLYLNGASYGLDQIIRVKGTPKTTGA